MNEIKIYINNEEVVCQNEIDINEEFLATSSVILNNCYPKEWEDNHDYVSKFYMPKDYSNVEIYRNEELIFAGILKNTGNISLRPTEPKFGSFQILDYKVLLSEGDTLDFVINDKTIKEAIEMTINSIVNYGFAIGNINLKNPNEKIGAYSTLNKTAYDVFQYLAEISNSRWFTRRIENNKIAIDFYSPENMEQANDIQYAQSYFEENNIVDMSYSYATDNYRNKQIVLSDQVFGNIDANEELFALGNQNTYSLEKIIAKVKKIMVNGVEKSFATQSEKKLGIYADFYYEVGGDKIEASTTYPTGTKINITYTPFVKGRQIVNNSIEKERIEAQINRNGTISRYETRNDILSVEELSNVAQTYIDFKGKPEIILKITTRDKDIFKIGQQAYFNMPELPELQANYMVKSKNTKIIQNGTNYIILYEYSLTSSFDCESAVNYFDNQRRKANGNISENEFITRNIDIENEATITFDNLQIEEISVENDNVLDCTLEATFVK